MMRLWGEDCYVTFGLLCNTGGYVTVTRCWSVPGDVADAAAREARGLCHLHGGGPQRPRVRGESLQGGQCGYCVSSVWRGGCIL